MRLACVLAGAALLVAGCAPRPAPPADPYTAAYRTLHGAVAYLQMQIPSDDPKRRGRWDDAFGSGIVVESGAWGSRILTDAHVVEGARDLRAVIGDRGAPVPAVVVARTPREDDRDLALLEAAIPDRPAARLGRSASLEPGEPVGVLGYPIPDAFDDERLGRTVSLYAGRIASLRRGALELALPIVPGESGGAVFAARDGSVVGIAASRFDEERAIGFATPIDRVVPFLHANARRAAAVRRSPR